MSAVHLAVSDQHVTAASTGAAINLHSRDQTVHKETQPQVAASDQHLAAATTGVAINLHSLDQTAHEEAQPQVVMANERKPPVVQTRATINLHSQESQPYTATTNEKKPPATQTRATINLHSQHQEQEMQPQAATTNEKKPTMVQTQADINLHSQELQPASTVRGEKAVAESAVRRLDAQKPSAHKKDSEESAVAAFWEGTVRSVEVAPGIRRSVPMSMGISADGDAVQLASKPKYGYEDPEMETDEGAESNLKSPISTPRKSTASSNSHDGIVTWIMFIVGGIVCAWVIWIGWAAWRRFKFSRNALTSTPQQKVPPNLQKDRLLKQKESLSSEQSSSYETGAETSTSEEAAQIYARVQKSLEHLKLAGKNGKQRAGQPHQGGVSSKSLPSDASTSGTSAK